ncbi:MAG TPA: heparan-alpha-glucosaminide N-acetyltransferase domain-containing protein [Gemmatimonadaceae bacterium]|nr:heparan-alpha-glucosaminide N-acetyltransferase domain-containing protein [Gemmatimonadaceae bacterium]
MPLPATSPARPAFEAPAARAPIRPRIESVDVVRGVIMVMMALDHTRDFFGIPGQNPTDLSKASAALFLTRWITHFCAPVFFLLTGTGAYLSLRKRSAADLSRFLFTRGLWLIFLEATIVRCLAYQFNFDYRVTILLVLWALGWAMITLSVLVRFPVIVPTMFGVVLVAGHNLLDGIASTNPLWMILHSPGFVSNSPSHTVFVAYPLIPWLGVTALGFSLGQVYSWEPVRRRAFLLRTGLALTAAFVVLRWINVYGDPLRWSVQKSALFTALSFLNVTKYPPSLLFLLMTLGPALVFLGAVDGGTPRALEPARIIGKVPMFYYVLHFALIHLLAVATCLVRYHSAHWMFESPDMGHYPISPPPGWGFSLPVVYLVWATVVMLMYPLCRWFAALKQRRSDAWLSYL